MFTKKTFFLFFLSSFWQLAAQGIPEKYAETISAEDLKKHLTYIASDELGGRDTGSEGQRKAADYIAKHFKDLGLTPIVDDKDGTKSYFQKFNLYQQGWKNAYVTVNNKKKVFFKDYYPNGLVNMPEEVSVNLSYVGNGNEADYKGIDVTGKAVLFLEEENRLNEKISIAKNHGATYFFMVSKEEANKFTTLAAERRAVLSRFNRLAFKPTENKQGSISPSFIVSKAMAAEMLGISEKKFNQLKDHRKFSKNSSTIQIKSERGDETIETMNVMGFMEGTDKKDEVVVITAHYDHVGTDAKGQIYNGADDDGSGTCAILELAEAFVQAKADGNPPRRSILFMTVTGEEKGLLGSQYFTDMQPIIPLEKIVCDLNIDMIGRVDKDHANNEKYVYLIGSDKLSSELHAISEEANKNHINYTLDYTYNDPKDPNRFYYRSDHYNFAKNKIPVIFYFTGVHEDYHQPTDDIEKIMFPKYQQIVRLVFHTAWKIIEKENRISIDSNKP